MGRVTYNRRTKGNFGTGCGFFSRVASSESPKSAIRIQAPPQLAIGRGDQACPDPFQRNGGSLRRNAGTPVTLVCGNAAQPAARCLTRVGTWGTNRNGTGAKQTHTHNRCDTVAQGTGGRSCEIQDFPLPHFSYVSPKLDVHKIAPSGHRRSPKKVLGRGFTVNRRKLCNHNMA